MTPEQIEQAAPLVAKLHVLEEELAAIQKLPPQVTYKLDENKNLVVILTAGFAERVTSQVSDYFVMQINDLRSKLRELGAVA